MDNKEIQKISEKGARELFEHEEDKFTPWLEQNIEKLEDQSLLGFKLEVKEREATIVHGTRKADILAKNPSEERLVIIENQFGTADFDHLGRALLYSADVDKKENADIIVWIAEQFGEACVNTINMINQRTDSDFGIYGIELNILQIGDSSPYGIEFTAVAKPEDWNKPEPNLTETHKTQKHFWERFLEHLSESGLEHLNRRKASKGGSHRIDVDGLPDTYVRPTTDYQKKILRTYIRVYDRDFIEHKENQQALKRGVREGIAEYDVNLPSDVVEEIEFNKKPENEFDIIDLKCEKYHNINFSNRENWGVYHAWLADVAQVFEYALKKLNEQKVIKK